MTMLNLDKKQISRVRKTARTIACKVQEYIDRHTTTSVERATLRMMGLDGIDKYGHPLSNILEYHLRDRLHDGITSCVVSALKKHKIGLAQMALQISEGKLSIADQVLLSRDEVMKRAGRLCKPNFDKILRQRKLREKKVSSRKSSDPLIYVIVATGNIYEDVKQARSAARNGADIVAIIRSTAQSLLDYVPYGPTTEGFGGTYATQANFSIMRTALDEIGNELGRYIMLVNYASGLCMPEIAVMGAIERLDMMLNDSMYGILFRDINMYRTFIDQHFSRMLSSFAGIIINTGEDNYLTTADAFEEGHTVLASDFINEQFACNSGLPVHQMGLGHAFEINPEMENSFLYELAQAMLIRECFPGAPLKYMPPTRYMNGNILRGYMLNTMFNLAGTWSRQGIQLLGILTEAIHTPHLHDRYLAIENARYTFNAARSLSDEIIIAPGGLISKRARQVLNKTEKLLNSIKKSGLMEAIEKGFFANIKRKKDGGKGLEGVYKKSSAYYNPVEDFLKNSLKLQGRKS